MSNSLDTLDPSFRQLAEKLIATARAEGIGVAIINTRRTAAEQEHNIATGVSQVKHSKHEDGLAIDLCPVKLLSIKGWAPADPLWWQLGEIGLSLGLRWGGKWDHPTIPPVGKLPPWFWDPGHFEQSVDPNPTRLA